MESGVFGRTNQVFPAKWLRLVAPASPSSDLQGLADAALNARTVIDISTSSALWGGLLRGSDATFMTVGPHHLARAVDEQQAHDTVLAHLIETLSGIGRERIDLYFLRVDRALQEFQISGALIALEEARQEDNVRFVGLFAKDVFTSQSLLHFHDAFELLLTDADQLGEQSGIRAMARARRMALIHKTSNLDCATKSGEATLYNVGSSADIEHVLQAKEAVA